jgi:hypothetical protein
MPETPDRPDQPVHPLAWTALACLLLGALIPAGAGTELFPYWDLDPTRAWVPSTGIRPGLGLLLAALSIGGAALAMLATAGTRRRWDTIEIMLVGLGSLGVVGHASLSAELHDGARDGIEHAFRAAPWLAMVWGAVGIGRLSRDPRVRTGVIAVLSGFAVMLLAKGVLQVFVEHPATLAAFERTKSAVFESKGWAPDSPAALAYERRLSQPEASGWFGLSNVYASFMGAIGAGAIAGLAVSVASARRISRGTVMLALVALAALGGLVLSRSKGGIGAMGLSLALCAVFAGLNRLTAGRVGGLGRLIGPGAMALVLLAIAARGIVGTAIGEKSLLFRAFYGVGSLRIWADHPTAGVGPDGFQDAYSAAKLPIATETVQSPHSVLFDWTATLGVFGLAWGVWFIWRAGGLFAGVLRTQPEAAGDTDRPSREMVRFVALVVAIAGLATTGIERQLATPEFAAARVLGLAGWLALAIGLLGAMRTRAGGWMAAGAGLALVAHAQIEVTPVWVNGAALFGAWFGATTAGANPEMTDPAQKPAPSGRGRAAAFAGIPAVLAILLVLGPGSAVRRWEGGLRRGAERMRPIAEVSASFERALAERDRDAMQRIAHELSGASGERVPARPEAIGPTIERIRLVLLEGAVNDLDGALGSRPGHVGTRIERDRLLLELAASTPDAGRVADRLDRLTEDSSPGGPLGSARPRSVSLWDWEGVRSEQAAAIAAGAGLEQRAAGFRASAVAAWERVDALSPYAVRPAVRLMDLALAAGEIAAARRWAEEALRRDALTELDPIAGLTAAERTRGAGVLGGSGPPPDGSPDG